LASRHRVFHISTAFIIVQFIKIILWENLKNTPYKKSIRKKPQKKEEQTDPAARPDSFHLPVSLNKKSKRNESGFHKTFLCRICSKNYNANSTQMRDKKSYGKGRRAEAKPIQ
jgi:hypothetical protein